MYELHLFGVLPRELAGEEFTRMLHPVSVSVVGEDVSRRIMDIISFLYLYPEATSRAYNRISVFMYI